MNRGIILLFAFIIMVSCSNGSGSSLDADRVDINWKGSFATAPQNPQTGDAYYNTSKGMSYLWDGSTWQTLAQNGLNGTNGTNGQNGIGITWRGTFSSAPSGAQLNHAYYNSTTHKSYIWDGDSWEILCQDWNGGNGGPDPDISIRGIANNQWIESNSFNIGKCGVEGAYISAQYLLYNNSQSGTLNFTGTPKVTITGDTADFTVDTSQLADPLAPYQSRTMTVVFNPTSTGTRSITLSIPSNDPDENPYVFSIIGTGLVWDKRIDGGEGFGDVGDGRDYAKKTVIDNENNIYVVGTGMELVNNESSDDGWIKKFDISGNEITSGWDKKFNYPIDDALIYNGSIFISGNNITRKFSLTGVEDPAWSMTFGGKLICDQGGNIYIGYGETIRKFANNGTEITSGWNKTISVFDNITALAIDSNGNLYIGGYSYNNYSASYYDWVIKKFSSAGVEDTSGWNKVFDGDGEEYKVTDLAIDNSDNVYVVGFGTDLIHGGTRSDWWIKKFSSAGVEDSVNWNRKRDFNLGYNDVPNGCTIHANYLYVFGNYAGLYRYTLDGIEDTSWSLPVIHPNEYNSNIYINDLLFDSNNNAYLAGYIYNGVASYSSYDWLIRKFDSSGIEQ